MSPTSVAFKVRCLPLLSTPLCRCNRRSARAGPCSPRVRAPYTPPLSSGTRRRRPRQPARVAARTPCRHPPARAFFPLPALLPPASDPGAGSANWEMGSPSSPPRACRRRHWPSHPSPTMTAPFQRAPSPSPARP
jgi:hypothetical protein